LIRALHALALIGAGGLTGCWQPPRADVVPSGEPRVIDEAIAVESTRTGIAQWFDPAARTIAVLEPTDTVPQIYTLAPGSPVRQIKPGERIRLTLAERLTVYVSPVGEVAAEGEAEAISPSVSDAKVLSVDRSYRLLTLLGSDGRRETFKVAQSVKLGEMEPGDDVAVESMQVVAVRPGQ
jgi:hypothetical protein